MEQFDDWQNNYKNTALRNLHLLKQNKWTDCRFLVGEAPNQKFLCAHKLILAAASPVFERMFYGNFPEKSDPIVIPDVRPDVFIAMLQYIYSDNIPISSFDNACELFYVAKKYLLLHVVARCTNFLLSNLSPSTACSAYELAKLFDEPSLMESSMEIIVNRTNEVLDQPNFCDIDLTTFLTILDCDYLNIETELDLFNALSQYASEKDCMPDYGDNIICTTCGNVLTEDTYEPQPIDVNKPQPKDEASSPSKRPQQQMDSQLKIINQNLIKQAVKKIRFLTLTPQEFAEGPAHSELLSKNAVFPILFNISSYSIDDCPMPEGFSISMMRRNQRRYPF